MKYNTHEHPRGYDPLGKVAWRNSRNESVDDLIKKYNLPSKLKKATQSLLNEDNIISEDI
jgi:hypothetical protein